VPRSATRTPRRVTPSGVPDGLGADEAAGRPRRHPVGYGLKPLVWSRDPAAGVTAWTTSTAVRGPVVFASNHSSHLDAPLILCSLPRRLRERTVVGAASDYFFDAWWRARGHRARVQRVPRRPVGRARVPTDEAARLVADGWSLLLFPEGTRSKDGWVQRFRHGAARSARLCVDLGIPAVPIAIRGQLRGDAAGRTMPASEPAGVPR
jgi:1-acyl-sn-glycerol-3-phosphate acyltransferase